jgi:hypothetical protein
LQALRYFSFRVLIHIQPWWVPKPGSWLKPLLSICASAAKSVAKYHYFYFSPKNQHFSKNYKKDFYQKYLESKSVNSEFCGIAKNVVA